MRGVLVLILSVAILTRLIEAQVQIIPARGSQIPDLSVLDDTYGTPLSYPFDETTHDDCAEVHSIEKTKDGLFYSIKIDLNLNGRGCKKVIPWTTAPSSNGMKIFGTKALETCFTNDDTNNCVLINSGPSNGISISFDPPVYSFPLSVPQIPQTVPFGNAGYYSYEVESKGACANYGYKDTNNQIVSKLKSNSHLTIALSFPTADTCDRLPSQSSFLSTLSASQVAQNILGIQNYPISTNSTVQNQLATLLLQQTNNMIGSSFPTEVMPYSYINASAFLRIIDPFLCKNSSSHNIGTTRGELHACPMTISEWNAILPDVVLLNETVDVLFGPNTTSFGTFQRDGPWIPPTQYSNALPLQFHRCNPRDRQGARPASNSNYASKHMPINLNFGPTCTALQADNSHITAQVSVGGFLGISNTADPFAGNWLMSVGFPVRNMNQIGNTVKLSNISAPGITSNPGMMDGRFTTTGGTNGNSLNVDMNALRYIICNGLTGSVTASGFNSSSGQFLGPLVSTLRNSTDQSPVWPNPFRYTSDVNFNTNCAGCTYPTIRSQKGWTVLDSHIWSSGQGIECGKYQSDHALWARVLAMINKEIVTINGTSSLPFFAKWNQTSGQVDLFLQNALKLNVNNVSLDLPELFGKFIPGVGQNSWVKWLGDLGAFSCRPPPNPYSYNVNHGQQAIPLCMMLQRQLYYQSYMLNDTLKNILKKSITIPDLESAARTGIFNLLAPNIWFGIFQKSIFNGNSEWLMYIDDTFDRTKNSILESDGIAENVTATIEILVPVSSVAQPFFKRSSLTTFTYTISNAFCQVFNVFAKPELSSMSFIGALVTFNSPYNNVPFLFVRFSTIFSGEANTVTFNYALSQITVTVLSGSSVVPVPILTFTAIVDGNDIIIQFPYDTVRIQNQYQINIPIVIGSLATNILPIIEISSYFQTNLFSPQVFYVNLSNSNTLDHIGCNYQATESTTLITPTRYSCGDRDCFSTFKYVFSPANELTTTCSDPNLCQAYSDRFDLQSCGFGIDKTMQRMEHTIHLSFDGTSVNYNLLSEILAVRLSTSYNILNCDKNTNFLSDTFFVKFCGFVANSITGQKRTIPCNNYILPLFFNNVLNQLSAFIDWGSDYLTRFNIYFTGSSLNFDVIFDPIWFIPNTNNFACENSSFTDVFCHFQPQNLIFSLNMEISVPFTCGSFDQNAVILDSIQIKSQLNAFLTLVDEVQIYKTQIGNFDPVLFTCNQNDALLDDFFSVPTTVPTTTSTITWSNSITLPSIPTIIDFVEEFDQKIQGILPPCAIDFSNVIINPDIVPMNSLCVPYVASGTYQIFSNCSLSIYGMHIPTVRTRSIPYYQNIYYVQSNFSRYFTYQCLIMPTFANFFKPIPCTVNGTTGARNGTDCYLYENLLQHCLQWWNLSCGVVTFPQAIFFLFIVITPILIGVMIMLCVRAYRAQPPTSTKPNKGEILFRQNLKLWELNNKQPVPESPHT